MSSLDMGFCCCCLVGREAIEWPPYAYYYWWIVTNYTACNTCFKLERATSRKEAAKKASEKMSIASITFCRQAGEILR